VPGATSDAEDEESAAALADGGQAGGHRFEVLNRKRPGDLGYFAQIALGEGLGLAQNARIYRTAVTRRTAAVVV